MVSHPNRAKIAHTLKAGDRMTLADTLETIARYLKAKEGLEYPEINKAAQALRQSADREVPELPRPWLWLQIGENNQGGLWTAIAANFEEQGDEGLPQFVGKATTINAACKAAIEAIGEEK